MDHRYFLATLRLWFASKPNRQAHAKQQGRCRTRCFASRKVTLKTLSVSSGLTQCARLTILDLFIRKATIVLPFNTYW